MDEVNSLLSIYSDKEEGSIVSPLLGNVCFASSQYGFCFTLRSFARIYTDAYGESQTFSSDDHSHIETASTVITLPTQVVASHLPSLPSDFGGTFTSTTQSKLLIKLLLYCVLNICTPYRRTFTRKPPSVDAARSFVEFLLEPLYKIFAQTVGDVDTTLPQVGVVKELFCGELQYTLCCISKPNFVDTKIVQDIFPAHVHSSMPATLIPPNSLTVITIQCPTFWQYAVTPSSLSIYPSVSTARQIPHCYNNSALIYLFSQFYKQFNAPICNIQ